MQSLAWTQISAKIGGDQTWDFEIVDLVTEIDYVYKEQDDIVKMDKFSTIGKVNKMANIIHLVY